MLLFIIKLLKSFINLNVILIIILVIKSGDVIYIINHKAELI